MPRHVDGWFDHKRRRWVIEYTPVRGGKTYKVTRSIRQLRDQYGAVADVPDTETGSLKFWRMWWQAKKHELDELHKPALRSPYRNEDLVNASFGLTTPEQLPAGGVHPDMLTKLRHPQYMTPEAVRPFIEERAADLLRTLLDKHLKGQPIPDAFLQLLPLARAQQITTGLNGLVGGNAAPGETSLRAAANAYLEFLDGEAVVGKITTTYANRQPRLLESFVTFVGPAAPFAQINADTFHDYYLHLRKKVADRKAGLPGLAARSARDFMAVAKGFVQHLVDRGQLKEPTNLRKRFDFGEAKKAPKVWSVDEITAALTLANERMRLWILLALNCGFTQMDLATLRNDHIDLERGYITRKRSKAEAGQYEDAPEVSWKLWPRTRELLRTFRVEGDLALRGQTGQPLVWEKLGGSRVDVVGMVYYRLKAHLRRVRPGFSLTFKHLRKTSATVLKSHPVYRGLRQHFLGHTPTEIVDRHYAAEDQKLFDEAVDWLGLQLGLVDPQPE